MYQQTLLYKTPNDGLSTYFFFLFIEQLMKTREPQTRHRKIVNKSETNATINQLYLTHFIISYVSSLEHLIDILK